MQKTPEVAIDRRSLIGIVSGFYAPTVRPAGFSKPGFDILA